MWNVLTVFIVELFSWVDIYIKVNMFNNMLKNILYLFHQLFTIKLTIVFTTGPAAVSYPQSYYLDFNSTCSMIISLISFSSTRANSCQICSNTFLEWAPREQVNCSRSWTLNNCNDGYWWFAVEQWNISTVNKKSAFQLDFYLRCK